MVRGYKVLGTIDGVKILAPVSGRATITMRQAMAAVRRYLKSQGK